MSGDDNRDLFDHDTDEAQNELLDELDSLKELLNGGGESFLTPATASQEIGIPTLDEVLDIDAGETPAETADSAIPVLEEVAFPEEVPVLEEIAYPEELPVPEDMAYPEEPAAPQQESAEQPTVPSEQELSKLIDMLVGHRLRRLRPKIKEEVMEELQRLYPELFS